MNSLIADMTDLSGRVVMITGAAGGIGGGIADALAECGATVIVADINGAGARERADALTASGFKAEGVAIDIGDEASVVDVCRDIVARHGAPWALVNNAGVQDRQLLLEVEADEWDRVLKINTRGPLLLSRELGRAMVDAKQGGRIVNVASSGVNGQMLRGHAAYVTSKTALLGLSRISAMELAGHGITVNTLLPGGVLTPGAAASSGPMFEGPGLRPPLMGMCEPRDMAAAVIFLISPAARFVTDQALTVDAGWSLT